MSRDPEIVSKNMRKIHSKDTSIEIQLRKALWHKGYRYRKNYKALPGSPDIVLTKYKIAIFCDSEFFHGKDWEILKLRLEKGKNPDYWIKKIEHNRSRDFETDKKLLFLGYMSDGTLWEGQIALYFRWTCLPDCAVLELDADYRRNNRRLS